MVLRLNYCGISRSLVIIAILLLAQSCACPTCYQPHAYQGPERPTHKLAILYGKIASQHDNSTYTIMKVNGKSVEQGGTPAKVYLPPGEHIIALRAFRGHYAYYPIITGKFVAGRSYQIKQDVGVTENNMPADRYYIEDMGENYTPWNQVFKEPPEYKVYK